MSVKWSKPTAIFGFGLGEVEMPPTVAVNRENLYMKSKQGFSEYIDTYKRILSEKNFKKLKEIFSLELEHFEMPTFLWAEILFDLALAYYKKTIERIRTIEILIPLYYGMTLSFVNKTRDMSIQQAEDFIEDICTVFEQTKPYLIERWGS